MEPRLDADALAAAIADGAPVDWDALVARAATPTEQMRLARFALLARVCGVHAGADARGEGDSSVDDTPEYRPGDSWGNLRIVERLAAGTFGTVYRAHDPALARDVALKILSLPASTDGQALEAVKEGRLLARVRHPNVVTVYGADQRDGRVGVWMELVEGDTLEAEVTRRGALPADELIQIARQMTSALAAVHGAGVLHRDIKTQNVMREGRDGRVVLTDFSAGRERGGVTGMAPWPATLAGSPLYLAPELLEGSAASEQSDLYALGVCLYRLATGRFPVDGESLMGLTHAHRGRKGRSLGDGTALGSLLPRLLAAKPAERPASAEVLLRDLEAWCRQGRQPRTRARLVATTLVSGFVIVACMALVAVGSNDSTVPPGAGKTAQGAAGVPVTTASDEARHLHALAEARLIEVDWWHINDKRVLLDEVDRWLERAIILDHSFASAWLLRARSAEARHAPYTDGTPRTGRPHEAIASVERALALSSRAPRAERAAIQGYLHRLRADSEPNRRDDLRASAAAYEEVLHHVPGDYWALVELERLYVRLQQQENADRIAIRGVRVHPQSARLAEAAANVYLLRRDRVRLRQVAYGALAAAQPHAFRSFGEYNRCLGQLLMWEFRDASLDGDVSRKHDVLHRLARTHFQPGQDVVAFVLATGFEDLGRFDDARVWASAISAERQRAFKIALINARQERWAELGRQIRPGGVATDDLLRRFAFMYIYAGWLDDAERLLALYRSGRVPSAWLLRQEFEATLRLAQGRPEEALAVFTPMLLDEGAPRLRMHENVARARLQTGDTAGAVTVLERIYRLSDASPGGRGYDWLLCVTLLAEVYRDAGRLEEAAQAASTVRHYLTLADADNPFAPRLAQLP